MSYNRLIAESIIDYPILASIKQISNYRGAILLNNTYLRDLLSVKQV